MNNVKRKNVFEHVYQNEIQIVNQRPILQIVNQILLTIVRDFINKNVILSKNKRHGISNMIHET